MKISQTLFVEAIEKRPLTGIWVTACNGGTTGPMVIFETSVDACPRIGDRLRVTVESSPENG